LIGHFLQASNLGQHLLRVGHFTASLHSVGVQLLEKDLSQLAWVASIARLVARSVALLVTHGQQSVGVGHHLRTFRNFAPSLSSAGVQIV
jgi:hypothetical protein